MLTEPEIQATQTMKAPTLGIDSRALFKGLRRNDSVSNINAFSVAERLADERFYGNMPMNAMDTDPLNMEHEKEQKEKLLKLLLARGQEANTMRLSVEPKQPVPDTSPIPERFEPTVPEPVSDVVPETEPVVAEKPVDGLIAASAALSGFVSDATEWETLPGDTMYDKFRTLVQRDNRMFYLLILLLCIAVMFVFLRFFLKL